MRRFLFPAAAGSASTEARLGLSLERSGLERTGRSSACSDGLPSGHDPGTVRATSPARRRRRLRRAPILVVLGLAALLAALAPEANAQRGALPAPPVERPGDRLPELELPPLLEERPPELLPPIPEPSLGEIQGDRPGEGVLVKALEIRGNTVIESAVLVEAAKRFLGQRLAAEGIEALRQKLTEVYVEAGYVNSGALVPAQDVADGVLEIEIVEGRLSGVRVTGLEYYREGVVRARFEQRIEGPLNIRDVEKQIRLLDQDVRIEQINARLRPGPTRGEAILEVVIREGRPWRMALGADNYEAPSVGAYAGRFGFAHLNPVGVGDRFLIDLTQTEGMTRIDALYELPVNTRGTRLFVDGTFGDAELVDNLLKRLDVKSRDASLAFGIGQTIWETPSDIVELSLAFERRHSKTTLGGEGISFIEGPQSGRSEISVVRLVGEWTHRGRSSVFAVRSMFSWGVDWLNPTIQPGDTPDGEFFSWYGQVRGAYQLPYWGIELLFRGDVQLSDAPLLSLEQFAIGGPDSVRGYRRNQVVRDQGLAAALDVRVPVWRAADDRTVVAVSPFFDIGYGWNRARPTPNIRTLSGIGAGLEWIPHPQLELGLEYAHGFRDFGDLGSDDLQDESVYFRVRWRVF